MFPSLTNATTVVPGGAEGTCVGAEVGGGGSVRTAEGAEVGVGPRLSGVHAPPTRAPRTNSLPHEYEPLLPDSVVVPKALTACMAVGSPALKHGRRARSIVSDTPRREFTALP